MNIFHDYAGAQHRMKVNLFPNYLRKGGGRYIAKTESEDDLTIDRVCETMCRRTGLAGNCSQHAETVRHFLDEAAYQLADGFGVNLEYFSIYPNVCGTLDSVNEVHDPDKNRVDFRFRILKPLRNLARHIIVDITGLAKCKAYIDEFVDTDEQSTNTLFVPDDAFIITGNLIKVAGDNPDCGVFFVPVEDPSKAVKVTRIIENQGTKIIGIAPNTEHMYNRIEIRTQFTGSKVLLKEPRVITSSFVLEAA